MPQRHFTHGWGSCRGDRLSLNFHLQANAKALITTAAAGKIYRSSGQLAQQNIDIQVDSGANLEWLPQETIVFDGAICRQILRVELAPQASILLWEITRFGRTAKGEKFLSGEWRSHTEIWQQNSPLWIDRQWLKGGEKMLESPHGLAGKPVVATLAWVGEPVTAQLVEKVRALQCEGTIYPVNSAPALLASLTVCCADIAVHPPLQLESGLSAFGTCCACLFQNALAVCLEFG